MTSGYQRIGALAHVPAALADFGIAAGDVLRGCGLAEDALDDPEAAISYLKAMELLSACVLATGCQSFGLSVGRRTSWKDVGAVGALLSNAPTLGQSMRDIVSHHQRYVRGAMFFLLPLGPHLIFGYSVYQFGAARAAHIVCDFAISAAYQVIRQLADVEPDEVLLPRDTPEDDTAYGDHFGAPVHFNAPFAGLVFSADALQTPIAGADRVARAALQSRIDSYLAAGAPDIVSQARRVIFPEILMGKVAIEVVADRLALHPRTLNRQLEAAGTTYRDEVEQLRYEAAQQLLGNTGMPVTKIGFAFGYAASSVFTRAFQRWSGISPTVWRTQFQSALRRSDPDM